LSAVIEGLALRWVVTALFTLSAAECLFAGATGRRTATSVAGHLLHFVMAVAMAVMAWPGGAKLPTTGPAVFFLLATAWFVVVALTDAGSGHRIVNGYHALMMLAMSWMYAVMNGHLLPGQDSAQRHHIADGPQLNMPAMEIGRTDMGGTDVSSHSAGHPGWIAAINWLWTVGFAVATVWWLYRYFVERRARPAERRCLLGIASQAMMAAGMAVMFGVML
jgi:hypothetical protein